MDATNLEAIGLCRIDYGQKVVGRNFADVFENEKGYIQTCLRHPEMTPSPMLPWYTEYHRARTEIEKEEGPSITVSVRIASGH